MSDVAPDPRTDGMKGPLLSASQMTKYRDGCQVKWAWGYIEGIKEPGTDKQRLGVRVHEILECWLTKGTPPDEKESLVIQTKQGAKTYYPGRIARSGLKHLPPPSKKNAVEEKFMLRLEDVHFTGFKDLTLQTKPLQILLVDHKTIGSFQYQKTEQDLRVDIQVLMYAKDELEKHPKVQEIQIRWVYYKTEGKEESTTTEFVMTREEVEEAFRGVLETAKEMVQAHLSGKRVAYFKPNLNHCGEYGGCYYRTKCAELLAQDAKGETDMGIFDKIKAATTAPHVSVKVATPAHGVNPPDAAPVAPAVVEAQVVEEAPKGRKGRPPGARNKPKQEELPGTPEPTMGLWLFVDCIPTAGRITLATQPVDLSVLLQPILVKVAADAGVADYRLIEYGAGPGKVLAAVQDNEWRGNVLVNSSLPEHKAVLSYLQSIADVVIRGI